MKRYLITSLVVLVGLSGCTRLAPLHEPGAIEFGPIAGGQRIQRLHPEKISPKGNTDAILEDSSINKAVDALQMVLNDIPKDNKKFASLTLTNPSDRNTLRGLLSEVHEGKIELRDVPSDLKGFCGLSTVMALQTVIDIIDKPQQKPMKTKGKIQEWMYNDKNKSGHLAVHVTTEQYEYVRGRNVVTRRELLHWDIDVRPGGYKVVQREGSPDNVPDPGDIFPKTIPLPDFKRDPTNEDSVWFRNLNHKLFAKGKNENGDTMIEVKNVYRQINDGPIVRLEDHAYYEIDECSCIDIMFDGYPPALKLPPQISYCLGRCKQPPILNSD